MSLSLDDLTFLTSPAGTRLLEQLSKQDLSDSNRLRLITQLRRDYAAEDVRAALELAQVRQDAVDKFGADVHRLFFSRAALEQASDPLVRDYRASMVIETLRTDRDGTDARIIDAGCGIGADTLAFAQAGLLALGLDIEPVRIAMARLNALALEQPRAQFDVRDVRAGLPEADAVFFDPARRDNRGKRLHHVEAYQPPLSLVRDWKHRLIVVKISPGVDLAQLEGYGGLVEFISVRGDLKEAVLWLGVERGRRATMLTGKEVLRWEASLPDEGQAVDLSEPCAWLVEPDPALIRAGLVQEAAAQFGGWRLDETIAYFTTTERPESPWVRSWRILDWMPFHVKRLRAYLRERNVGGVTVKKRGSAMTPDSLIDQLKLKGTESRTLVLTRLRSAPIVLICEDIHPSNRTG